MTFLALNSATRYIVTCSRCFCHKHFNPKVIHNCSKLDALSSLLSSNTYGYRHLSMLPRQVPSSMSEMSSDIQQGPVQLDDHTQSVSDQSVPKPSKRALKKLRNEERKRKAREEGTVKRKKKRTDLIDGPDCDSETSYYFQNGLRKVYPYYFTFSTFAKGRWYKRTLLDVFCKEFKHFPDHIFKEKIANGQVMVNKQPVTLEYKLKDNDFITHVSHRHEVPVTTDSITIIHESDELLVINKPSSIPCHPCGSFRHNSVIFILRREHGYKDLRFVHRLDRLTSGLLIFAKTEKKAAEISRQVASRQVEKEYMCRVDGEFPSGIIECNEPMDILSFKLGLQKVSPTGKEAKTTFERISFNGKTSVVQCKPHTGRTHQIRVHLQYLGYPIINDPLYNSEIWGPLKGKGGDFGKTDDELIALMLRDHDKLKYVNADLAVTDGLNSGPEDTEKPNTADSVLSITPVNGQNSSNSETNSQCDQNMCTHAGNSECDVPGQPCETKILTNPSISCDTAEQHHETTSNSLETSTLKQKDSELETISLTDLEKTKSDHYEFNNSKMTFDPTCLDCHRQFKDPKPEDLILYLHAYKYKGADWEFSTPLPSWTEEN